MFRLGVTGRGPALDRELARPAGRTRRFSLLLLKALATAWDPADEPLLNRLYLELVVSGNVHKTTKRDRFTDLDARIIDDLLHRFPTTSPLVVHDLGASSAITSLQLFRSLSARRPARMHATDWFDCLYFVDVEGSSFTVVFGADSEPLQYVGRGFVISTLTRKNQEGRRFPGNRMIKSWLDRRLLPTARAALASARQAAGAVGWSTSDVQRIVPIATVTRLPLVHPECAAAGRATKDFTFGRHNAFETTAARYHCVRAMNFLNPGYFDEKQLRAGVRACALGLEPGGLLVIGRTIDEQDARNRATAFVRTGSTLTPAWDLHDGSEIRPLAAAVTLD